MTARGAGNNPLFLGVSELCDEAARQTQTDGAAAAILTRHTHTRELVHATDGLAAQLDELQFTLGEGPCLDAYLYDTPQFYPDLDSATRTSRWPTFATEVTRLGVHALFAFPIPGPRRPSGPAGVLELYRRTPGEFTEAHKVAGAGIATAIALQLQSNWDEHVAQFSNPNEAIDAAAATGAELDAAADPFARTQIHVAAGVLAHRLNLHPNDAVDRLRAHAYATGRRLSSVAADIIAHRLTLQDHDPLHP